ncbi:MAG: histidine phosphatase family protein [Erysipelotrichaceae bacterium]|nr:histidine phosphatase family protein [Erysipelotrichaceae bacterium]
MKLIFIRHGDPDYVHDTLTEQGITEAEALIPRMKRIDADFYYVSPLGRAKKTAEIALSEIKKEPAVLDFLKEFPAELYLPRDPKTRVSYCWDWYPTDWAEEKIFYDPETFGEHPIMKMTDVKGVYDSVTKSFGKFLEEHGYRKKGHTFEVLKENHDTLCFFCHLGVECVILSYLINVSPMVLWHGFAPAPTSVTTVYTEEREKGIASFRIASFGDISHLYDKGIEPAFAARFCECFSDDTRH